MYSYPSSIYGIVTLSLDRDLINPIYRMSTPNNLFPKFDTVLSLGCNCLPKLYLNKYVKSEETQIFDYLGTPIYAIASLIENKWSDLTNSTNFTPKSFFNNNKAILAHNTYQVCFPHDIKKKEDLDSTALKAKMQRRIQRFEDAVKSSKNLLLIRFTLSDYNKDTFKTHAQTPEGSLDALVPLMKSTYGCGSVTVVYINDVKDGWNNDHTVFYVKADSLDIPFSEAAAAIHDLFTKKGVYSTLA